MPMPPSWPDLWNWFKSLWDRLEKLLSGLWHQVDLLIDTFWQDAFWYIQALRRNDENGVRRVIYRLVWLVVSSYQQVLKIFIDWWSVIGGTGETIIGRIEHITRTIWSKLRQVIEEWYNSILSLIIGVLGTPAGFLQSWYAIVTDLLIANYNRAVDLIKNSYQVIKDKILWLISVPAGFVKSWIEIVHEVCITWYNQISDIVHNKYRNIVQIVGDLFTYNPSLMKTKLAMISDICWTWYSNVYNLIFDTSNVVLNAIQNGIRRYIERNYWSFRNEVEKVIRYYWEGIYG
jgi:phage-related protein